MGYGPVVNGKQQPITRPENSWAATVNVHDRETFLIVPAVTDQAGYCRIVSRKHLSGFRFDLKDYRAHPERWVEAGRMNSRGELVSLNGPPGAFQEIQDCEPLMAGLTFTFELER